MKLLSSIFSSETLKFRLVLPVGALLALIIVAAANSWAWKLQQDGVLYSSIPRQMIEDSIGNMTSTSGTWFIGNSTLAAGLDRNLADQAFNNDYTVVQLGSATLDVLVKLAIEALSTTTRGPERIILFVTKDDLNAGGSRAKDSILYMQAFESPGLYEILASFFPVYSCRYAIVEKMRNGIAGLAIKRGNNSMSQTHAAGKKHEKKYKDLSNDYNTTYLHNLGRNYHTLPIDFTELARIAHEKGTEVLLVAPPVTAAVLRWQQQYAPDYDWNNVFSDITNRATSQGILTNNYTGLLESTSRYFKDVYHLNNKGASEFTSRLLVDMDLVRQ